MVAPSALETERRDAAAFDDAALAATWRHTCVDSSSVLATRSTTPRAPSGTVRSIVIRRSSRAAPAPLTSGPPSVSRESASFSSPCEAVATTSPAPRGVTAAW